MTGCATRTTGLPSFVCVVYCASEMAISLYRTLKTNENERNTFNNTAMFTESFWLETFQIILMD